MFWETLTTLCARNGISVSKLCSLLELSNSISTKWKRGALPNNSTMKKIADYFGIGKSELLGEAEPHRFHFDDESAAIAQEVFENRDLHFLMKSARGCKPEHIRNAAELLQALKETNPDG